MLGLPKSTEMSKQLPKKAVYAKFQMNTAAKEKIDADISRITIVNEITPAKINIPAGEEVGSFFVLLVALKKKDFDERTVATLSKLIPQNILFVLEFEGQSKLAIYHTKLMQTNWKPTESCTIEPRGLNLDKVWENIVVDIGGEYRNGETKMILGNIASVATLILFVFYFIGRIITIVRNRYVFTDELRMMGAGFDNKEFDIVEVFDLEKEAYNTFILTSRQGIYDLAVYRILYDSDFNQIGRKRLEKSTYSFLNIGQSLAFRVTSPEIFTTYEVEYYTPDYKRVTIALWDNPKNGVLSESAKPKNTFKSVMFHLFN